MELNPKDPGNYKGLGWAYNKLGQFKQAIKWFKRGLKFGEQDSYEGIGWSYKGLHNYPEALRWLLKAKKACTDCSHVDEFIGRVYAAMGEYEKAEQVLTGIVSGKKEEDFGYWGCPFQALGELYSHMSIDDQKKKVIENYIKSANRESYRDSAQFEAARVCYEYGDYVNALSYVNKAISLTRNTRLGFDSGLLKGYILINMRQYVQAEKLFVAMLDNENQQQGDQACVGLGHIALARGDYPNAQEYFQRRLRSAGDDIMADLGMAWLFSNQSRYAEALPYYDRILSQKPSYILALLGKGNALMGLKRLDESEKIFKEVLRIDPNNEYALAELGMVAYNRKQDKDAETLFAKALNTNNATYTCPYEGLGLVYLKQGKTKEAEENFKKAIQINPDIEYKKYNGLAKIYIKQGRLKEARQLLEKSIQNYPYDDEAKELLRDLGEEGL
jgi:tetratricopeptide (TPR) repeat protein